MTQVDEQDAMFCEIDWSNVFLLSSILGDKAPASMGLSDDDLGVYVIFDWRQNPALKPKMLDVGEGQLVRRLSDHAAKYPSAYCRWAPVDSDDDRKSIEAYLADTYGLRDLPGRRYPDVPGVKIKPLPFFDL